MKFKYLDHKHLPPQFHISSAMAVYLFMQHFHAPGWVYAMYFTLYSIGCLATVITLIFGTSVKLKELE